MNMKLLWLIPFLALGMAAAPPPIQYNSMTTNRNVPILPAANGITILGRVGVSNTTTAASITMSASNLPNGTLSFAGADVRANRFIGRGNVSGDFHGDGSGLSNLVVNLTVPDVLRYNLTPGNFSMLPGWTDEPPSYSNYWVYLSQMDNARNPVSEYRNIRAFQFLADTNFLNAWIQPIVWSIPCNDNRTNVAVTFYMLSTGKTCVPWRTAMEANSLGVTTNALIDQFTDHNVEFTTADTNIITITDTWTLPTNCMINIQGRLGNTTNLFTNVNSFWLLEGKVVQW